MTRHFFSEGIQERFAQSRFDAIRELGRIAEGEDCHFMVVCGDVFESNLIDRKTVSRVLKALNARRARG
jgi:DNA repair exonuclease SbcCD nuclease subunit